MQVVLLRRASKLCFSSGPQSSSLYINLLCNIYFYGLSKLIYYTQVFYRSVIEGSITQEFVKKNYLAFFKYALHFY